MAIKSVLTVQKRGPQVACFELKCVVCPQRRVHIYTFLQVRSKNYGLA